MTTLTVADELHPSLPDVVAEVNGEELERYEVGSVVAENRAKVYRYFYNQYGVAGGSSFWKSDTLFGDESPVEMLLSLSVQEAIRRKVLLQFAYANGLVKEGALTNARQGRSVLNDTRKQAVSEGKVVYGPVVYSDQVLSHHFLNLLQVRLESLFLQSKMKYPDWVPSKAHHPDNVTIDTVLDKAIQQSVIHYFFK